MNPRDVQIHAEAGRSIPDGAGAPNSPATASAPAFDPDYGAPTNHPHDPRVDDIEGDEPDAEELARMQDEADFDREVLRDYEASR